MWSHGMAELPRTSQDNVIKIMKMIVPGSIVYVSSIWAIKIAMVLFYKRLAAPKSTLQLVYNVALGLLVLFWGVITLHIIFQCFPHDKRWSKDPAYKCDKTNKEVNYWLTASLNVGTDIATITLPIYMVLKLQMKLKQKLAVAAVFALGLLAVVAGIVRAYFAKRRQTMLTCTVSIIETSVAIITACLPPLRSVILGPPSSARSGASYQHYELSAQNQSRKSNRGRVTTEIVGGPRDSGCSEEELVKDRTADRADVESNADRKPDGGVRVTTTLQMQHGVDPEAASKQV
ncbi:hypothetical protein JDV02_005480 [Purpureocillium takamizusanense]|nr:uncharacterized protein JDV02_005480 [Purpureocillium takamizusanense]UNI19287.1 hypothetical protein JDV02_005480 [Purpureocillium takamizusanense]